MAGYRQPGRAQCSDPRPAALRRGPVQQAKRPNQPVDEAFVGGGRFARRVVRSSRPEGGMSVLAAGAGRGGSPCGTLAAPTLRAPPPPDTESLKGSARKPVVQIVVVGQIAFRFCFGFRLAQDAPFGTD